MAEEQATAERQGLSPSHTGAAAQASNADGNPVAEGGDATAAGTRKRKKRKWDQPAEGVLQTMVPLPAILPSCSVVPLPGATVPGIYPSLVIGLSTVAAPSVAAPVLPAVSIAQQSAVAIVQKINQDLVNKGLIPQAKIQDEVIAKEIVINDAEPGVRYKLTKRQTQEEIQMKTGSVVITRGKYKPPNAPVDHEKPLYLHISAGAHLKSTAERVKAVDQAAALVEEILKQCRQHHCPPATQLSTAMMPLYTATVFLGLELNSSFDIAGRIRGPSDQYINHIMNETGATVVLKGRVSSNLEGASVEEIQPLHLYISSDNPKSLDDAKRLAENLMETIRSEFLGSKFHTCAQAGAFCNLQQTLPGYQVPSYAATSMAPGSSGSYYSYSLPQLSTQLLPGGPLMQPEIATTSTNRWSSSKSYTAVPPPKQLLTSDQQTAGSNSQSECGQSGEDARPDIATADGESHTPSHSSSNLSPSTAVNALPAVGTSPSLSFSHASNDTFSNVTTICPSQSLPPLGLGYCQLAAGSYPQASQLQLPQSSAAPVMVTCYSAYSGIYPQATPLQQVALALQRPPPSVSVKPGSAVLGSTVSKDDKTNSIQGHIEKPERQRRKFQEFPVAAKEPSRDNQVIAVSTTVNNHSLVLEVSEKQCFAMPPPNAMPPPSPKNMPPPPSRNMLPPPPKNMLPPPPKNTQLPSTMGSSTISTKDLLQPSSKNIVVLPSARETSMPVVSSSKLPSFASSEDVTKPSLRLVDYGDDDDDDDYDDDDDDGSAFNPHILTDGKNRTSYANGKPFWAV